MTDGCIKQRKPSKEHVRPNTWQNFTQLTDIFHILTNHLHHHNIHQDQILYKIHKVGIQFLPITSTSFVKQIVV